MKPYDFPGANIRLGEGQPEYQVLPAVATEDGQIVTCWRLSLWEAVKVLFTRRIWVHTLTHGRAFQPMILSAHQLVTMPNESDPNGPMVPIPRVGDEPEPESDFAEQCRIPPPGWWCSRPAGHDGPCAARPVE